MAFESVIGLAIRASVLYLLGIPVPVIFALSFSTMIAIVWMPPGVCRNLVEYSVLTYAATGISMNYRHWGNADADVDRELIESAYGYEAGLDTALKRFTKQ